MVKKQQQDQAIKNSSKSKHEEGKSEAQAADGGPEKSDVDRPGFDLGGSTGKTSAGTGVGLGPDAAENRSDRRLPGRRGKSD